MDTAKKYKNSDGDECNIRQMVREEPFWAANRIQEGEKAIEEIKQLREKIKEIEEQLKPKACTCDRCTGFGIEKYYEE